MLWRSAKNVLAIDCALRVVIRDGDMLIRVNIYLSIPNALELNQST